MYHLQTRSSYNKRAFLLSSSSFPRIFRSIVLIAFSVFFFTILYINTIANYQIPSERRNNVISENENTSHTSFEISNAGVLKGHTFIELLQLESTWNPSSYSNAPLTIVIAHINNKNDYINLEEQLDSIFNQTVKPKSIWIITSTGQEENINNLLREKKLIESVRLYVVNIDYSGPFAYLQILQRKVQTKYILLMKPGMILGYQYLQNMLYISNTKEYNNTLLGTMGVNFNNITPHSPILTCYEDHPSSYINNGIVKYARTSRSVDLLTNVWFLQKQWISMLLKEINKNDAVDLPLEFLISFALRYHSNIPSNLLPTLNQESWGDQSSISIQSLTCDNLRQQLSVKNAWKRYIERGYPLLMKESRNQNKIIFVIDGPYQEKYFRSLYCKLSLNQDNLVNVITTGNDRGLDALGLRKIIKREQSSCGHVDVYDLDIQILNDNLNIRNQVYQGIEHMIEYLKPELLIYVKVTKNPIIQGISSAIETNTVTAIKLPLEEIEYITGLIIDLPFSALKNWNEPKIQLQIITQDRPDSLSRLINSLNTSFYFGDDNISLTINMDRGADPVTKELCLKFQWNHGPKHVRHRVVQGGLLPAIIESYYPYDYNDYGVLLEDDIEVSPFYYLWIKYTILKYRYGPDKNFSQRLFGVSLYGQRQMELHMVGRRPYDPESIFRGANLSDRSPYLSQIPCSWGAVYFPEIWREFHDYLSERLDDQNKYHLQNISVPGSRSYRWKKSWKKFFIELVYLRGYVMLYPNYKYFTSFSTNHAEIGIHIHFRKNKPNPASIFGVPLMKNEFTLYKELPNNHLTDYMKLPVTDLWGNLTTFNDLIDRGIVLHNKVSLCSPHFRQEYDQLNFSPKDILCVDEEKKRIAIRNYKHSEKENLKLFKVLTEQQDVNPMTLLMELIDNHKSSSTTPQSQLV